VLDLGSTAFERLLTSVADPELGRASLGRVFESEDARATLTRPDVLPAAARLLGFSSAAADFLVAHPDEAVALADLRPRSHEGLAAELEADVDRLGPPAALRRFRRRSMLRVAALDLSGAPFEDVVHEITAIADTCLEAACRESAPYGVAVIALGKLGGRELNYASDVDVVFVHAGGGPGRQTEADRACASFVRLLAEPATEGIALRVDATLRPGGGRGPLSRSLDAMRAYYDAEAATWERQALIKARPVAGDPELGPAFVEAVAPFAFPTELAPAAIDEVRRVKVRLEEYVRATGKAGVEVKRGRGGIRDVEFAVQLLQIVHGGRDERLREPNTLRALDVLAEEGYVAREDAAALADAYRFLRVLEHRLQIVRDLQTHELPSDPAARTVLARSLAMADADELQREYERQTASVRELHERLFYRPLLESFAGPGPGPGRDRGATEELLGGLGFGQPSASYEVLSRLIDPATRQGKVLARTFPVVAPALALAADPDAALVRLERVMAGCAQDERIADALAGDPGTARRLAHVVAASSFSTDLLAAEPARVLSLRSGAEPADAPSALVAVAARYAARELGPIETGAAFSDVADGVVAHAVAAAEPDLPFAAIGLGKLGARELNVASDLDVVFVYEGEGPGPFRRGADLAEDVLAGIRAAGWDPDPDLRPEGRSGPLARSLAGYLEYWERYAETWEFQSLIRARFVAGDDGLGRRFCSFAQDFAYPEYLPVERVAEIRRMRARIEQERVRPPEAARFHFKLGFGSLADVQFAAELTQMRSGRAHADLRTRSTLEALEAAARLRLIEDAAALALGEAFVFLNDVKDALEIDRRVHAEAIPAAPEEQLALARRLGYEEYPRQTFLEDYRRITRRARRAMERVFFEGFAEEG
jgi:[glutamine synthetase] adenylyltransferase / [glutamine synthetase]-adenylyl-L-tyrosine phosphorylase